MELALQSRLSSNDLFAILRKRRTTHHLGWDPSLNDDLVVDILRNALLLTPSFFHSQTSRVLLLLGAENAKLWGIVTECLEDRSKKGTLPRDTMQKLGRFGQANGTILFYEDFRAVSTLKAKPHCAKYVEYFDSWAEQTNAMHQIVVWTALCSEGVGVTVQHYNPLIDEKVRESWNIDAGWHLVAQMVFGKAMEEPPEKIYLPLDERICIHKSVESIRET